MTTGKVVEIVKSKGYGCIETDLGEKMFCHQRWLKKVRFKDLCVGSEVAFSINQGPRGPRAYNIILSSDLPQPKTVRIAELLFKE
jgi:cold shock CspA family protein